MGPGSTGGQKHQPDPDLPGFVEQHVGPFGLGLNEPPLGIKLHLKAAHVGKGAINELKQVA